jgi:regulator of replication initiation timing
MFSIEAAVHELLRVSNHQSTLRDYQAASDNRKRLSQSIKYSTSQIDSVDKHIKEYLDEKHLLVLQQQAIEARLKTVQEKEVVMTRIRDSLVDQQTTNREEYEMWSAMEDQLKGQLNALADECEEDENDGQGSACAHDEEDESDGQGSACAHDEEDESDGQGSENDSSSCTELCMAAVDNPELMEQFEEELFGAQTDKPTSEDNKQVYCRRDIDGNLLVGQASAEKVPCFRCKSYVLKTSCTPDKEDGHTRLICARCGKAPAVLQTKKCGTCHQELPLTEYAREKKGAMGVKAHCRGCSSQKASVKNVS